MRKRNLRAKFLMSVLAVILAVSLASTSVFAQKEGDQNVSDTDELNRTNEENNTEYPDGKSAVKDGSGKSADDDNDGRSDIRKGDSGGPGRGDEPDGGKGNGGSTSYSDSVLTVPEGLANGTYAGTATVQADENENFTNYTIRVSVTVTDGKIVNVYVSGAGGSNLAYSNDALSGITKQVAGTTTGEYTIDTVSSATCSSKAIIKGMNAALKGTPSLTTYSVNEGSSNVTYLPTGSKFTVTITNPVDGIDYSKIGLAYGVGKFADDMKLGDDFSVSRISKTDTEITYQITINPESSYVINDDGLIHSELYNTPGRNLTLTVGDEGLGTVYIRSTAIPVINNNVISLTGGNGETLDEYLTLVDEVTVSYTDKNGAEQSTTYATRWQHDMEPAFSGSDLFNADRSINFNIIAEVTRQGEDFEAIKDENGNNVTYEEAVFPYGADWNYYITLSAGDGYDDASAWVGSSAAPGNDTPNTNGPDTDNPNADNKITDSQNNNNHADSTSSVKTGDITHVFLWIAIMGIAVLASVLAFKNSVFKK